MSNEQKSRIEKFYIRNARTEDLPLLRQLFAEEGFGDLSSVENVRVAATRDNIMYGAIRCEKGSNHAWYVRPIVVFDSMQGHGVGKALLNDALKQHVDLRLSSRGEIGPFYESCGMQKCFWEDIAPEFARECKELCPDYKECAPQPYRSIPAKHTLTFLGTSSGCGVPAFFCHCPACEEARKDPTKRRGCTGVVVQGRGTLLIDAPPDLRHQLNREHVDRIDEFFLTHAHFDHMGGLGELEYYIRLHCLDKLPFRGSSEAIKGAFEEFSYMQDIFEKDEIKPYGIREFDGILIQALPVKHCPGSFGYLLKTPYANTFYAPDTAQLEDRVIEILQGVDNLIMDATFWKNRGTHITHHLVKETIDEGINLLHAQKIYLQHLAPHMCDEGVNEIEEIYKYAAQFGGRVIVAEDGMKVQI